MQVGSLAEKVATDPALADRIKQDPAAELAKIAEAEPAYKRDVWTYRIVVLMLGFIALGVVIGAIVLFGFDKAELPSGIVALGSAAVGALAGLLAPSPSSGGSE